MKRAQAILALVSLISCTCVAYGADLKEKQAAGANVAANFLVLLDNGKFGEAWKQLSPKQQPSSNKDQWQSDVSRYRHQVGKLRRRTLLGAEYTTKVPGGEEGEYVVVTFMSSFERLGSGLEIVVPQLLPNGNWVISGYSIKPADVTE